MAPIVVRKRNQPGHADCRPEKNSPGPERAQMPPVFLQTTPVFYFGRQWARLASLAGLQFFCFRRHSPVSIPDDILAGFSQIPYCILSALAALAARAGGPGGILEASLAALAASGSPLWQPVATLAASWRPVAACLAIWRPA